ncbi:MAG: pirin family protein [Bacteroidetes bacterium]|nr:pirin family protein [Bacteroidota bacterium]
MEEIREVILSLKARAVTEGAGVRLRRVFGNLRNNAADPFLLLDDFGSDNPDDYTAGFPWHPHRGIETVTYILAGKVEHEDSLGNKGTIGSGDVQWMTAGSGIIHQEMPKDTGEAMRGFQLWVNLPGKSKMTDPHYRDVNSDRIPVFKDNGIEARIICGKFAGLEGPVKDLEVETEYFDIKLEGNKEAELRANPSHNVLIYLFEGEASTGGGAGENYGKGTLLLFGKGNLIKMQAGTEGARFLYFSGKPIGEPVAWYGPVVMNTKEELETAFREISDGTFLKK